MKKIYGKWTDTTCEYFETRKAREVRAKELMHEKNSCGVKVIELEYSTNRIGGLGYRLKVTRRCY